MSPEREAWLKTGRIEALSDGVFAIAMTILVLSFECVLQTPVKMDEETFMRSILDLWPDFLHYVEGFVILGAFWFQHHRQFHYIKKADVTLLFINIAGLMFVSLTPFTAAMVSDYGHIRTAALLFELNMFIAGCVFLVHWLYASHRHRLVDEDLDKRVILFYTQRNMIIPVISLAAIVICQFAPRLSTLLYLAVPGILFFWSKIPRKEPRERTAQK